MDRTQFYLVDLPGYGFARTNRHNKEIWSGFIRNYLTDAPDLVLVCQLIDIRHRLMDSDIEAYQWMVSCGLQVQLVLTKMDKLSKSAAMAQVAAVQREMSLTDAQVMAYSGLQPVMRFELINRILGTLLSSSEVVTEAPALR